MFGQLVELLNVSPLSRQMWEYPPRSITPRHRTCPSGSSNSVLNVGSFRGITGVWVICCLWDVCDLVWVVFPPVWGFPVLLFWVVWFSLGRSAPGVAVGGALTGIIYQKRECWLVFNSVSSCVFANFATVRCRIHSRFCLEGMVCSIVVLMLWRRK